MAENNADHLVSKHWLIPLIQWNKHIFIPYYVPGVGLGPTETMVINNVAYLQENLPLI